ncbi:MAG: hypothetical protein WCJ62_03180 [Flavobacterium sp.]
MKILRVLGFKDFLKHKEIIKELKENDSTQDFSVNQHILFVETPSERLWMIGSKSHVFFVLDTGTSIAVLEKKEKGKQYQFSVNVGEKYARLVFEDTKKEIPFNILLSGGTETVINNFKKFLNE